MITISTLLSRRRCILRWNHCHRLSITYRTLATGSTMAIPTAAGSANLGQLTITNSADNGLSATPTMLSSDR